MQRATKFVAGVIGRHPYRWLIGLVLGAIGLASGLLALVQQFGAIAFLATAFGVVLLAFVVALVRSVVLEQRLAEQLQTTLPPDLELAELRAAQSLFRSMMPILDQLSEGKTDFVEERAIVYRVGERPEDDFVDIKFKTTAPSACRLHWRTWRTKPSGQARELRFADWNPSCSGGVKLLPLREGSELGAMAVFVPSLGPGDSREWALHYRMPGLWNPLRQDGKDTASFLIEGGETPRFTMTVVAPHLRGLRFLDHPPVGTTSATANEVSWTHIDLPHDSYRFTLADYRW